ncbi:MAG TPA: hypothetical protein VHI14_12075 [Jatrophihabitantaceae bacterium]|nr:hypothetical protein [Jatrophihabitantaceae bacterium]
MASGQVTQFRFSGKSADAAWETSTATSVTDAAVTVSTSNQGSHLFVTQFTAYFDTNGNFTGATDTIADVTSGFSFALGQSLASASLSGSGLPATTCTFDANFNQIGCTASTIDVTVTWTGQGPISRGVTTSHSKSDGFSVTNHFNGTFRDATATGTVGGLTLSASELHFADLAITKTGTTIVCIGNGC